MNFDVQSEQKGFALYRSHKQVRAAKIEVDILADSVEVQPGVFIEVDFRKKPTPAIGWYVVCYPDGYISFSPPDAFEEGYTLA